MKQKPHRILAGHKIVSQSCESCHGLLGTWEEWHQVEAKHLYCKKCCPVCNEESST